MGTLRRSPTPNKRAVSSWIRRACTSPYVEATQPQPKGLELDGVREEIVVVPSPVISASKSRFPNEAGLVTAGRMPSPDHRLGPPHDTSRKFECRAPLIRFNIGAEMRLPTDNGVRREPPGFVHVGGNGYALVRDQVQQLTHIVGLAEFPLPRDEDRLDGFLRGLLPFDAERMFWGGFKVLVEG